MNAQHIVLATALLGSPVDANRGAIDPTRVHGFVLDAPRVGRRVTAAQLPKKPTVTWRIRVSGGVAHPPSVDGDGSIVVAHTLPLLAQYDSAGRVRWTAPLGTSPAAASPLFFGDGTRLALTEAAEAYAISPRGRLLWRRELPLGFIEPPPALVATQDGAVLIGDGKRLVRLDAAGHVALLAELQQGIRAVLGGPGAPLVIGNAGTVARLLPNGGLRSVAELGGAVDAAVRLSTTRLLAVIDSKRLVELDLATRATQLWLFDPSLELSGALSFAGTNVRLLASPGLLLAFAADGAEQFRAQLSGPTGAGLLRGMNDLIQDRDGSVLLVRPGLDAVSVQSDGTVVSVPNSACADPLRPAALPGARAAVLSCRTGLLARLDESGGSTP